MAGHFQTARGRFVVVNGYFPKGSGPARDNSRVGYKLDFSRTVFARAQALRRRGPVLVIGDYNTAHHAIDLARPQSNITHSRFLPEERAQLDHWLCQVNIARTGFASDEIATRTLDLDTRRLTPDPEGTFA